MSYLSVSQAKSQASGVHFLRKGPPNPNNPEYLVPTVKNILLVVCKIICNIMASAAEAEYSTIFVNAQTDVPTRITLTEMASTHGPTSIQIENSTLVDITTKYFRQK